MLYRFEAHIGGVSLANLDPAIALLDIKEDKPVYDRETARRSIHPGTRMSVRTRRSLSIRLVIAIKEYNDMARAAVLDKIADWAGDGGWLTISTRPGQRLYVIPEDTPALGSSMSFKDEIEMTLTAYERPYWERQWPVMSIVTDEGTLCPLGTYPTAYVECDVTNAGEADLTEITMSCGDTAITLTGLAVPAGEHVTLSYTDRDVLTITAAGASVLANRTAESHDDLIALCRKANAIRVTADQPVSAVFSARGRYR